MQFISFFSLKINIFIFNIENQILLNSTRDLKNLQKDHRITNTIQSENSFSSSRLESNTRFYHLVND
jgi:hypothetical protein